MNEELIIDLRVINFEKLKQLNQELAKGDQLYSGRERRIKAEGALILRAMRANAEFTRTVKQLDKERKALNLTEEQYNNAVEEALVVANKKIATDKDLIRQAKKTIQEDIKARKEKERLTRAYAPNRVAAEKYQKILEEIKQAQKDDIITKDEMARALDRVTKEYKEFTAGVATGGNQFAKFNVAAYKATQGIKRNLAVGFQQAGYQVGDFIVQIQSGQNALVAFGQQGSQLAGIFGPYGAVAGAFIALATGLAMIAQASKDGANAFGTLESQAESLGKTINKLNEYSETISELLEMPFVNGKQAIIDYFRELEQQANKDASKAVSGMLGRSGQLGLTYADIKQGTFGVGTERSGILGQMQEQLEELMTPVAQGQKQKAIIPPENLKKANALKAEMKEIAALVYDEQGVLRGLDDIAEKLLEYRNKDTIAPSIKKAIDQILQADGLLLEVYVEKIKEASEALEDQQEVLRKRLEATRKLREFEEKRAEEYEKQKKALQNLVDLSKAEFLYGKDSLQLKDAQKQKMMDQFEEQLKQNKLLDGPQREALLDLYETHLDTLSAIKDQNDLLREQEERIQRIAAENKKNPFIMGRGDAYMGLSTFYQTGSTLLDKPDDKDKKSGGGRKAKTPAEQLSEYLTKLRSQAQLEKDLVGVSSQRREIAQEILKLEMKYGELVTPQVKQQVTNDMKLKDAAEQAHQQRMDQLQQQADMFNFVAKSYGDFLYDVLAGNESTAKSFENMANKVIAHLFDVLVMQQMIGTVGVDGKPGTGLLGILGFEGGGYTGRGPRSGGIDGRGGFMAVLHPNETVIDHTKGQGGGSVVINQNFNIAANGDDTVRQIVANEAPKIANMATAAVLEKRKRGGAMRSTFG